MDSDDSIDTSVDIDFDSLLENEDIGTGSEKGKLNLSFNELFEKISEECSESVEGLAGDSQGGNVDDDFEALLNDQDHIVSFSKNEAKAGPDNENKNVGNEVLEKISEEFMELIEGVAGESPERNVDDDFEALLNDQDQEVNFLKNKAKTDLDNENFVGKDTGKDDLLGNKSFGNEVLEQMSEEFMESVEEVAGNSPGGDVEDDFEALLNDQVCKVSFPKNETKSDLENKNKNVGNAVLEQISEECMKSIEGVAGESPGKNFDDDFDGLLNDQDHEVNFVKNEAKTDLDEEKFVGKNTGKDDNLLGKKSDGKGFSQIFSSPNLEELQQNSSDGIKIINSNQELELGKTQEESSLLEKKTYQDKLAALNKLLIEERNSFQHEIKKKVIEASKLRTDIEKLRNQVKKIETDKDAAEEKILNLLEKQRTDSNITEEKEISLDREKDLLSQIQHLKERIKVQDDIIAELQEDNTLTKKKNGDISVTMKYMKNYDSDEEDTPEDPKKKIVFLEHELEDQKEVAKQLKAYVGDVLENIMVTNPQMLERK